MSVSSQIKSNNLLKQLAHRLLIPANEYSPRLWVKILLNPFKHKRSKGSIIRSRTKLDVFPFNEFQLGRQSVIEDFATVNNGVGSVIIGNKSLIGIGNVIIGPVQIGDNVILAQHVVISGLNHSYEDINIPPVEQKVVTKQVVISDNVWIGANSVITAGVTVGRHAVVGAGSVVTKDIPDFSVAVGNPARVIKKYNHQTKSWEKV
jgi:acetyltransferase-like isoleucine patch superfamily enzyme